MILLAPILATALFTVSATPTAAESSPYDYDVVTIAPNVYGFIEKRLNPVVSSNVVAIVGTKSVLVFDSGNHPTITRHIIEDLRHLTDKPVQYLVISHWHDDHWVGNAEFAKAYPGVQVIAHEFTADLMETRKDSFSGEACKKGLRDPAQGLRDQLASGKRADGTPISDVSRQRMTNFIEALDWQIGECDGMAFRGVDRRITDYLAVDLGGRRVEIKFLGRGNTAGDLTAYVPDQKLLLTGDLLVHPFPFATQPYISEWAKVLGTIDAMQLDIIVPGHGPVMRDKEYLHNVTDVLESINTQARAAYQPGMTVEQLRGKIDLSVFTERFAHGDPFLKANFDVQMNGSAIERMWQELTGQWKPEGIPKDSDQKH